MERRENHTIFIINLINLHLVSLKIRIEPKLVSRCHCEVSPSQDELDTLRRLVVRLKSGLFLVQVYGTANETLLIIPESSYSYLRSTRITSGYPVGVLSVSLILQKTCVSQKSHTVCVIKRVSLHLKPKMVKTETKANDNDESGQSPTPVK